MMRLILKIISLLYSIIFFGLFIFLLFLWETFIEQVGGLGVTILLVSGIVNLILLWALSGLADRVKYLEDRFQKMDEEAENEWFKSTQKRD